MKDIVAHTAIAHLEAEVARLRSINAEMLVALEDALWKLDNMADVNWIYPTLEDPRPAMRNAVALAKGRP